jgi:hypothetical protein
MLRTRWYLNTVALALYATAPAAAQEARGASHGSTVFASVEQFIDDGESGLRLGTVWIASASFAVGGTGRWWGNYKVLEPEARWYPLGVRREPFVAVSGIAQQHGDVSGYGLSLWAGAQVEVPVFELPIGVGAAIGWRSLYRSSIGDSHWFRLRTGVTMNLW